LKELSFQGEIKEKHARHIIRMLMEIGQEFPAMKNDIISSLTFEGLSYFPNETAPPSFRDLKPLGINFIV
jgi:hypothetical protein